jgi:anti-sigma28 factor (negative regulator of flagellin synthesis)
MKITNSSIETVAPGGSGTAAAVGGSEANQARTAANRRATDDSVSLSNASQLVNLAKTNSVAPDHAAKLASLAALVRTGQYSADTAGVSHAVVEGHIQ